MPTASDAPFRSPVADPVSGLVRPVRLDPLGISGPTKSQAGGRYWVRVHHGWYVPVDAPRHLVEQRILEESVRLPMYGAVTGWAGCRLHGAHYLDGLGGDGITRLPIPLNAGPHRSLGETPRAVVLNHVLLATDRTVCHGIPTVIPERATYDAMRVAADLTEAVTALDMMAAARQCSIRMLRDYAEEQPQDRARVLAAAGYASEHALSPTEVAVRLTCVVDLGLHLEVNSTIHDLSGRRVAMVDLLDVEAGLVIEVDGAHHEQTARRGADLRITDVLLRLGLEEVRISGPEARRRRLVVERVRLARSRSRFEPRDRRSWYSLPRAATLDDEIRDRRTRELPPSA